jgi:hypothetical protein
MTIQRSIHITTLALALLVTPSMVKAGSFERFHGDPAHQELGGSSTAARTCPAGGFLTIGSSAPFAPSPGELYAVRTAADGTTLWERTYRVGDSSTGADAAVGLHDGSGFVLAGSLLKGGGLDLFLMKIDCSGAPVWTHSYPGPQGLLESAERGLIEAENGDLVLAGLSIDDRNDRDVFKGLVLRTDASGRQRWSRLYEAGAFTAFRGVAEVKGDDRDDDRDLVVVGDRQAALNSDVHPFVLRLRSDGRLAGRRCDMEYQAQGSLLNVAQLGASAQAGDLILSGRILQPDGNATLLVRADGETCQPVVERLIGGNETVPAALAELKHPLPGAPRGSLAVVGETHVGPTAPSVIYLQTISPTTLRPLSAGHLFGDHSTQVTVDTRLVSPGGVVPLSDGFAVTGDSSIGPLDADENDNDLYVIKTDARGGTACDAPWRPQHRRVGIPTAPLRASVTPAGLGDEARTDVTVEERSAGRNACE